MFCNIFVLPRMDPTSKLGAWGNDDFGLGREFYTKEEALEVYNQLIVMENVSKDELELDYGFDVL